MIRVVTSLSAMALVSISALSCNANDTIPPEPERLVSGYRHIALGQQFIDVIGEVQGDHFSPILVMECMRDMPLKGCFLLTSEEIPFTFEDGIPYDLSLSFNNSGQLTDIELTYQRKDEISFAECQNIHERTIDWVTRSYGPMVSQLPKDTTKEQRSEYVNPRTQMGNEYWVSQDGNKNFFSLTMRTFSKDINDISRVLPISTWDDQRYVSVLSFLIDVQGKPFCWVNVSIREPSIIERMPDRNDR